MPERAEKILRNTCAVLCVLVFLQFVHAIFQACRLVGVKMPAVPTLTVASNATLSATSKLNVPAMIPSGVSNTEPSTSTHVVALTAKPGVKANLTTTNVTNAMAQALTNNNSTGASAAQASRKHHGGPMMMAGGPGFGAAPTLPPEIQTQVDAIVNSEILGPAMHPLPMALLGIAGDTAFLRTDDGQTGLVKEGDSLGNLKLLQIGVNRVLVEQNGQKKELTIFDGYGGDSLLSNKTKTQNEND